MIDIEEFARTTLKVATIRAAEAIPKSRKLLKLTVDLGGEQRTLVAGIAEAYDRKICSAGRSSWSRICSRRT